VFLGITAITVMPEDIFPEIDIPVVSVIWQYTGLSTPEMEQRVSTYGQYSISSNVNGIKNMEAQTLNGISVQKIYFQPDVNLDLAIAQIVSATNSIRAPMPTGIQPPTVVAYNASSVPVLQLSLSSDRLNQQQLYDYGIYNLRQQLAPVHGVTFPTPDGGKYRQIMVDIDSTKLAAKGFTPADVVSAVNAQTLTLPSGLAKIGNTQYTVRTNAMPTTIADLNNIPISYVNGQTVFMRDVGQVHDGWAVQQNVVRENGRRSVLLSVIKNGGASTLAVVDGVRKVLAVARQAAPPGLSINELFDQSKLVTASPVYDIYAAVQGPDLGSVSDDISKIVAELQKELKPGNTIQVLGQIQSMNDSFRDLSIGLLFAAVFVYMLMVVNYQNLGDPFVVILALPATLCGIVTMLFITGTTLRVRPRTL
jgi:multidrug efflux pump subunit AcrB